MSNIYYGNTEINAANIYVFSNVQGIDGSVITNLESIEIASSVTSLGDNCFSNCTSLSSITIPSSVTSLGAYCFSNCTSLSSITIPSSVTSLGAYCFSSCASLSSATIPASVTSIGNGCFCYCTSLSSITIPSSVTSLGANCFDGCTSLSSITIPSSVTSIAGGCFSGCTSLSSITIPSSVASIGYNCFNNCTSLSSITIPALVTSLPSYCFYRCTSLKAVYFKGLPPNIGFNPLSGVTPTVLIPSPASSELLLHLSAQGLTTSGISAANGVVDISGRGNHGQAYNGVTVTATTDYGNAFGFPNNNSYIDLTAKKATVFTQGNAYTFSVSFYITEKPTRANGILVMWVFSAPQIQIWLTSDYKIQVRADNGFAAYTASAAIALNTFYNVTVSCNYLAGTRTIHINGQAVSTTTRTAGALTLNVSYMVLGNHKTSTGYNLPGYIIDVRIYGKALSQTDAVSLYKSVQWTPKIKSSTYGGASSVTWAALPTSPLLALDPLISATGSNGIKDISGNGYHGTIAEDTLVDKASNSFVFDGNGDYITVDQSGLLSAINSATGLTYSCTYIPATLPTTDSTSSTSQHRMLVTTGTSTSKQVGSIHITTDKFFIADRLQSSDTEKVFGATFSPDVGIPHTYTATMDYINGIVILYVDGKELARENSWWTGHKSGIAHVLVGGQGSSYSCNGKIKNVRIYNRVLTSAEVAALHDNS